MEMDIFQNMEKQELKEYIDFLLRHYRVVNTFWFIYVNERVDQKTAEKMVPRCFKWVSLYQRR